MNKEHLSQHPYIIQILELNRRNEDRKELHKQVGPILQKMGSDKEFLKLVIRRNFDDEGYLNQKWSHYNIPYLFIYENDDLVLKIHFFASHPTHADGIAAHCIHHHNNYILTTAAILGSGYETMLFDKKIDMDEKTLETKMRISKHFTQQEFPVHTIDSWEPHIVYLPQKFSATLQLWTPDKKRVTDALRQNPILKAVKTPLRKLIQMFGLESKFGIAKARTFQWYPNGNHFLAIDENEYFAPTKAAMGPDIDDYSIQTVCKFIQEMDLVDTEYLNKVISRSTTPAYYQKSIKMLIDGESIPETFAKEEINIPAKKYNREDVLKAAAGV
jgi:hypothetical protein